MTKEELLPVSEFPFRARQAVEWPEQQLRLVSERYYRNHQDSFGAATKAGGFFKKASSLDGTLSFEFMGRRGQEHVRVYMSEGDAFVEVDPDEVFARMGEFLDVILDVFLLDVLIERFGYGKDEDADRILSEKLNSAPWEVF